MRGARAASVAGARCGCSAGSATVLGKQLLGALDFKDACRIRSEQAWALVEQG